MVFSLPTLLFRIQGRKLINNVFQFGYMKIICNLQKNPQETLRRGDDDMIMDACCGDICFKKDIQYPSLPK